MSASSDESLQSRFEFVIDGRRKRSQIHRHVAHECYRRRLLRKHQSMQSTFGRRIRFPGAETPSPPTNIKDFPRDFESRASSTSSSGELAADISPRAQYQGQAYESADPKIGLLTILGASRRDRFDTYPIQISPFQEQLLDEYVHYPNCEAYGFVKHFKANPIHLLVQAGIECPIIFHVVLANAAYNRLMHFRGSVKTQRFLQCEVLTHKIQAIRMSNAGLQAPSEKTLDSVLHTAMAIAHLECKNKDKTPMIVHHEGIRRILCQLPDPWVTLNHTFEKRLIIFEMACDRADWSFISHINELPQRVSETKAFLEQLRQFELNRKFLYVSARLGAIDQTRSYEFVPPYTRLYHFLSRDLPQKAASGDFDLLDENNAQLGCLILASLTVFELRYEPSRIQKYLHSMEQRILEYKINNDASEWCLLWILFLEIESTDLDARRRIWSVMQMMNAVKSTDTHRRQQMKKRLLGFLCDCPGDEQTKVQPLETIGG